MSERPDLPTGSALRFVLFGAFNTAATALLYWALAGALGAQAAYACAFACGIVLAYAGNATWVFRGTPRWATAAWYPVLYGVHYGVGAALLALATGPLGLDERLALLPVLAVTVPLSFALNRALLRPRGVRR
jgi:putative flippase GtrA